MGKLNGKFKQTPKQFVEEGRRYDEIAEHNRRAQNLINLRAILKPLTQKEVNKIAAIDDQLGEVA